MSFKTAEPSLKNVLRGDFLGALLCNTNTYPIPMIG